MLKFNPSRSMRQSTGFTLAEMVLVVAVMAILVSVTATPLYMFIQQRDLREEQNTQLELQKAMRAMLADQGRLPTDVVGASTVATNWFNELARYTNLSPSQIRFDTWGNERRYISLNLPQTFLGNSVPIFYATILSAGPDAQAEAADGIAVKNGGRFVNNLGGYQDADASGNDWWKVKPAPETAFATLVAGGNDIMTRLTDYPEKIESYNRTLGRLERVAQALESYAQNRYAEASVQYNASTTPSPVPNAGGGSSVPEDLIYYPASTLTIAPNDNWNNYSRVVMQDYNRARGAAATAAFNPVSNAGGSVAANTQRRTDMVALMRVLGLPDEFCCSALETFTDGTGTVREMPFYYASNPRPRTGTTSCGNRPNPSNTSTSDTPLPARIGVTPATTAGSCY